MWDFLSTPAATGILLLAAMAALVAVAIYVIGRVRGATLRKGDAPSELITNFRELHSQGDLSDEEFRTIKAKLDQRLRSELKDSGESV